VPTAFAALFDTFLPLPISGLKFALVIHIYQSVKKPPMASPYFSIIVTTHQRPHLLARALKSVRANTLQDHEVIVIADTLDPDTMLVVTEHLLEQDTVIKRTGKPGPALSRNMGLQVARGRYVIFLDDDDAFLPDYLANAKHMSEQHPGQVIYTNYRIIQEDRQAKDGGLIKVNEYSVAQMDVNALYVKNFIQNHSAVFPRESVLGRQQDPHLSSLDDWDFLLNVASDTPFTFANILGAVVYKDYVNPDQRRGSAQAANGLYTVSDYLSIYKKWPAPTPQVRQQRQQLLASAGQSVPLEWL
jgi:glycosyltransferase involved in cell wall biosynthesis